MRAANGTKINQAAITARKDALIAIVEILVKNVSAKVWSVADLAYGIDSTKVWRQEASWLGRKCRLNIMGIAVLSILLSGSS